MPSQYQIEVILMRELASYLAIPIFLVDPGGNLLFYNEPAEAILGLRFDETGEMPLEEWATRWSPTGPDGQPLPPEELPLVRALASGQPATGTMIIEGSDEVRREIEVTGIPLVGQSGRNLGAAALFWERPA